MRPRLMMTTQRVRMRLTAVLNKWIQPAMVIPVAYQRQPRLMMMVFQATKKGERMRLERLNPAT